MHGTEQGVAGLERTEPKDDDRWIRGGASRAALLDGVVKADDAEDDESELDEEEDEEDDDELLGGGGHPGRGGGGGGGMMCPCSQWHNVSSPCLFLRLRFFRL